MFTLKRLISGSLFVFVLACTALAQENLAPVDNPREPVASGPVVTATATAKRVRFVSPGSVVQLRLEVYNEAAQKLFDTELRGGNVLDWHLQDGVGTISPLTALHLNQPVGAGPSKGLFLSGDEFFQSGNGASDAGILLLLGVNPPSALSVPGSVVQLRLEV